MKNVFLATVSAVALSATAAFAGVVGPLPAGQTDSQNINLLGNQATGNASITDNDSSTSTTNSVDDSYNSSVKNSTSIEDSYNTTTKTWNTTTKVTSTELNSFVADTRVNYNDGSRTGETGNSIDDGAFSGATGVIAVSQNSGVNTNNQQAITVSTGDITVGGSIPSSF
jgi:hypothetical protein